VCVVSGIPIAVPIIALRRYVEFIRNHQVTMRNAMFSYFYKQNYAQNLRRSPKIHELVLLRENALEIIYLLLNMVH
jgi:hypothetical protein